MTLPPSDLRASLATAGRSRAIGVALLILASVLWSLSGVAVKLAHMDPLAFAFYRSLAAAVLLALLLPLARGGRPPAGPMLASAIVYTLVVGLLITAMTRGTAAAGILLQYTAPAFCALFAWIFLRRRIDRRTAMTMAIALGGILIMILGSRLGTWVGPLAGLGSGIAFGGLILLLQWIDRSAGGPVNLIAIVLINNAAAAVLLLPLCAIGGMPVPDGRQLLIVVAAGWLQLAAPYILFQLGLRRVSPVDASLLILLEPVLNPLWVALATSERPDGATLLGGAAIMVALLIDATKKPAPSAPATG